MESGIAEQIEHLHGSITALQWMVAALFVYILFKADEFKKKGK